MNTDQFIRTISFALALCAASACTTIPVDQRDEIREEVNQTAEDTIARMVADDPGMQASLDKAVGYLAARISSTKLPVVGGGYGFGVLHDKENGSRTYLNVTRFDLGAGLGAGRFRVLVVFENPDVMERFRDGTWQSAVSAASAVGTHSSGRVTTFGDGYAVHVVSEAGATIAVTARMIRTSINHDLTDTGVSEVSIPNIGFASVDEQGEDAPRVWDRKLPFWRRESSTWDTTCLCPMASV
jgi:lipid-binding SYLF domain-containing protein